MSAGTPVRVAAPERCGNAATPASPVGSYSTGGTGAADPDYTVVYVPGALAVTPAPVAVTASSQTVASGTAPAAVTPLYAGLVNSDRSSKIAPICATTATTTSLAGAYPATCSGGVDPNYFHQPLQRRSGDSDGRRSRSRSRDVR